MSNSRIAYARVVLEHAPELADAVPSGATPLNDAYETARDRRSAASSRVAQMARLRGEAPDLADLVVEERMTLAEALAALLRPPGRRGNDAELEEHRCDRHDEDERQQ